ncbi:MAG: hypothetical protein GY774_04970 [Planctomycetes bacterium]|nr:hypothetical protein [Planctomycetota bacterium]
MQLKRLYSKEIQPAVSGVKVLKLPRDGRHNFSPRLVNTGELEGWLVVGDNDITINSIDGAIVFKILRAPGRYGSKFINFYETTIKR